jgi:hypothetical protein
MFFIALRPDLSKSSIRNWRFTSFKKSKKSKAGNKRSYSFLYQLVLVIYLGTFRNDCYFKTRLIGADCETPAGAVGQVRLMQAFTPRWLTARPANILSLQSTTPLYLVNCNKVCENSLYLKVH